MKTWILPAFACLSLAPAVQADVLTPDMTLRITFTIDNNFNMPPNTLKLNFGLTNVISPYTVRTGKLFDGTTLLGQHDATSFGGHTGLLNLDPSNSWTAPGSPWTFDGAATGVDFTTILDGTIQGVIEYTIQTGAHDIPANQINLTMIQATSSSGGYVVTPVPTITSIQFLSGEPGAAYCPGDGIAPHVACPCGNNNDASMSGCDWMTSGGAAGGALTATGSASMAANDTYLVATNIENNFGIFFGANNQVNSGNGNPLNDGLRCAGGGLVRLIPPTMASGNQATTPLPVQTLDIGAAPGVTRRYQYWFRTPSGPCGQMANLTNGYEIVWMP